MSDITQYHELMASLRELKELQRQANALLALQAMVAISQVENEAAQGKFTKMLSDVMKMTGTLPMERR